MFAVSAKWLVCSYDRVYQDYGLVCDKDQIHAVLPNAEIDEMHRDGKLTHVIDRSASILLPGFVDAHIHLYGVLAHGIPNHVTVHNFEEFLKLYWWPMVEDRVRKAQVLSTTRSGAAELLRSGVTALCDTLEAPFCEPDTLVEQGGLLEEIGLRGIVSLESSQRAGSQNGEDCLAQNVRAARWLKEHAKLVRGAVSSHTTFTCTPDFIRRAKAMSREAGTLFQFHLSESVYEPTVNPQPTGIYDACGALDDDTLASQCVQVDAEEIRLLAQRQVKTVHMPLSNCEVGGGIAPVSLMLESGICVGLGSDGYINDFFTIMKAAFLIHKANEQSAAVMPASLVFRMATEFGAHCLGYENLGSLEAGYLADFIVLEDRFLTPVTPENIFDQLIVYGEKESVSDVFVNGRQLMENRRLLTLDEDAANRQVRETAEKFWEGL